MWDSDAWASEFREASAARDGAALHRLRADVFQTTVEAVRARQYEADGAIVHLDERGEYQSLHGSTVFYLATDDLVVSPSRLGKFETVVEVINGDCLVAARDLATSGDPPLVLNMASHRNPGGDVLGGAGAQEENIFRRSNLLWSLYQFADYADEYDVLRHPTGDSYPIPRESGGIYSPPAKIFRSSEDEGYAFLAEPYEVAFASVPAINRPDLRKDGDLSWLTEEMADATTLKIRAILRIAAQHAHQDLVLSAFGCGAFRNPPQHMAQLFKEVLAEGEFLGVFRTIVFAIIDDHNSHRPGSPDGNFRPFERELGS